MDSWIFIWICGLQYNTIITSFVNQIVPALANGSSLYLVSVYFSFALALFQVLSYFMGLTRSFRLILPQSLEQPGLQGVQLPFIGALYLETKVWVVIYSFNRNGTFHRPSQWTEKGNICKSSNHHAHLCTQQ